MVHARTATPEFSSAAFTHTKLWGITRNPWNLVVGPGGSSGGSGAALASGTATLATGSDIGGSIRIPASLCGVVGYKPPYGRVPALPPFNLDHYCHDGPMARSVGDVALLHNVIAGQHPVDPVSLPFPGPILVDGSPARIAGRRIAWARTIGDTPVEPEVAAATARVAASLADMGAVVEEVEIPVTMDTLFRAAFTHYGAIMGPSIDEVRRRRRRAPGALRPGVPCHRGRHVRGGRLLRWAGAGGHDRCGRQCRPRALCRVRVSHDDHPRLRRRRRLHRETRVSVDGVELDFYLKAALTPLFNLMSRRPVLAIPSGIASNGVPMGVQVVGHPYDDQAVFDVAAALETVAGWWASPHWRPVAARR